MVEAKTIEHKTCQWNFYADIALNNFYVILVRHLVSVVQLF